MFYSLGGGTGSGLGSRLLEELSGEKRPLLATAVLPIASGENPMQCYNVLLALNWLQDLADGVLLYENDSLLSQVEADGSADASLKAMNQLVARDLVPHLCPPEHLGDVSELKQLTTREHKVLQAFSGELKSLLRLPRTQIIKGRAVLRGEGPALDPLLQRLTGCAFGLERLFEKQKTLEILLKAIRIPFRIQLEGWI